MRKTPLVDQKIPMRLNEIDEDYYHFSALDLKGKALSKDAKIKEEYVEVKGQSFYSARRLSRKITMPKSINH